MKFFDLEMNGIAVAARARRGGRTIVYKNWSGGGGHPLTCDQEHADWLESETNPTLCSQNGVAWFNHVGECQPHEL